MKKISLLGSSLLLSSVILLLSTGCGSSDESDGGDGSKTKIGSFVDAPVQGIKYKTATHEGFTDINGNYEYEDGEKVEFFLGNLSLGKVTASNLVTPYTLAGDTDLNAPSTLATNLAQILQSLDDTANAGTIVIPESLSALDISNIDLTLNIDADLQSILTKANSITASNYILVNESTANANMKNGVEDALSTGTPTVTSPFTGKVWMDKNLGADRVCTMGSDTQCYGDYYQWGRDTDGHEKPNSATTDIAATNIINAGNKYISGVPDWTTADSNGSLRSEKWAKTDGSSVCPVGFRVPTVDEIAAELNDIVTMDPNVGSGVRSGEVENNFLKLGFSGHRSSSGFANEGFLTILLATDGAYYLGMDAIPYWMPFIDGGDHGWYMGNTYAYSVRCIKN